MRFSRQPNGKWCGYSTISDSFYAVNLDDEHLSAEVVADLARIDAVCKEIPSPHDAKAFARYSRILMKRLQQRMQNLLSQGGYNFDDIINEFRYYKGMKETRAFWLRCFKRMGCTQEQMDRVNTRLDDLEEAGDLCDT